MLCLLWEDLQSSELCGSVHVLQDNWIQVVGCGGSHQEGPSPHTPPVHQNCWDKTKDCSHTTCVDPKGWVGTHCVCNCLRHPFLQFDRSFSGWTRYNHSCLYPSSLISHHALLEDSAQGDHYLECSHLCVWNFGLCYHHGNHHNVGD